VKTPQVKGCGEFGVYSEPPGHVEAQRRHVSALVAEYWIEDQVEDQVEDRSRP